LNTSNLEPRGLAIVGLLTLASCTTLPLPEIRPYAFPRDLAWVEEPNRPYETLGVVKTRVEWPAMLRPDISDEALCRNFYNKAVRDLIKRAREAGGDAVAGIRSVVFLFDGQRETHSTPECSDEGDTGQILLQGTVVKFKKEERPAAGG